VAEVGTTLSEQLREQQRALSRVLRAIAGGGGLQAVLDEIVEAATALGGGDHARIYLLEGGALHALANFGATDGYDYDREHPHAIDRSSMAGRAALERAPIQIPDVLADPEYTYEGSTGAYRAGLGLPILLDDELLGSLAVVRAEPGPFPDETVELVKAFADQAAIAIRNARLLETIERQLEQQRAVADVLGVVARSEGLQPVFTAIVSAARALCAGQYAGFYAAEGGLFRVRAVAAPNDEQKEYEQEHPHVADRTSIVGRVALSGDVVHIPDLNADPEYSWPLLMGHTAGLGVPVIVDGELIGVVTVTRTPDPFTEDQIELVKTFAGQAAIAIANARLIEAVERQRSELSRFVSPQVAELISSEDGEKMLAGHRAYVSVLFCDLRGFTAFAETAAPEELFEVLGEYHGAMGRLVPRYEGTLEHFAGDGLMVFFNDPLPVEQHELKAIGFALAAQECFAELSDRWRKRGIDLGLGIGIAAGYATLGRIGFEGRYDYGALGPVSNLASRLSSAAQAGQTLIAQRVYAAVEEEVEAEELSELELKGFGRPVVAYRVVAS
jgi:class 3 adenylate cyclase